MYFKLSSRGTVFRNLKIITHMYEERKVRLLPTARRSSIGLLLVLIHCFTNTSSLLSLSLSLHPLSPPPLWSCISEVEYCRRNCLGEIWNSQVTDSWGMLMNSPFSLAFLRTVQRSSTCPPPAEANRLQLCFLQNKTDQRAFPSARLTGLSIVRCLCGLTLAGCWTSKEIHCLRH